MQNVLGRVSENSAESLQLREKSVSLMTRVVLIEDDVELQKTFVELLALLGYDVIVASEGESGLEAIRTVRPDVIICDLGLPGTMDGYAIARAVRQEANLVKTFMIALTGRAEDNGARPALINGFDVYIRKPVEIERLAEQLQLAQTQRKYNL